MLKRIPILLLLFSLGACCCGPVDSTGTGPVHAVRLGTWYYLLVDERPLDEPGRPVLGPEYARVLRKFDSGGVVHAGDGVIEDPCGFRDGDSDVLPAGTTLHPVGDIDPGQRVGAVQNGWLMIFAVRFPPD